MISVHGLRKTFEVPIRPPGTLAALRSLFRRRHRTVVAVDGISFEIAPGERVGFLGPNGAGKTTTLKVLSGLLHPTEGEVSVGGFEPRRRDLDFLKRITLVMGQKQQLLWDLPPSETFELNRAIYGVSREAFRGVLDELVDLLDLGELIGRPARQLSLGERMKCELAAALIHRPRFLFLDEPTIGLDVTMQATIRTFIRDYNTRYGATLMLTSHYMDDVAALCPRIIVVDHGRITYDGGLEELVRRTRPEKRLVLTLDRAVDEADLSAIGRLISFEETAAVVQVPAAEVSGAVSRALAALPVRDLSVADPPLEEVMQDLFAKGREEASRGETVSDP
jgi:ABC-2 type transport system ATP-binding protein